MFSTNVQKIIDFRFIFGGQNGDKSWNKLCWKACLFYIDFFAVFFGFLRFLVDFGRPRGLQKSIKNRTNRIRDAFGTRLRFFSVLGTVLDGFGKGFGRVLGGFWTDLGRILRDFFKLFGRIWGDRPWLGRPRERQWMDGEVLIIGKVVGSLGGVPKCLTCVKVRRVALISIGLIFEVFLEGRFFRFFSILGRFWKVFGA